MWESSASAARASIERSFKRLRTDVIDLLQIHNMAGWREVTPTMQAFQREGRIRYLGVTDRRPENFPELIEAMKTGAFDAIQIPYYLGEVRCREEVLPLAREMDLGVIVMRPFSHLKCGLLGPGGSIARMPELKAHHAGTPGQALLKYLLADESVSSIIPATGRDGPHERERGGIRRRRTPRRNPRASGGARKLKGLSPLMASSSRIGGHFPDGPEPGINLGK